MIRRFAVLAGALLLSAATPPSADTVMLMLEAVKVETAFYGREAECDELSPGVLSALATVPRQEFVPAAALPWAWENRAHSIGMGRTLPQPHVSGLMAELLGASPGEKVLEVGTGSGYQAAILARLARQVRTVEPVGILARESAERLSRLGIANVAVRHGDGLEGWPEEAPFDAILVTLAVGEMPLQLVDQLRPGGRMLVPLTYGGSTPYLTLVRKNDKGKLKPRPRPLLSLAVEALPPVSD